MSPKGVVFIKDAGVKGVVVKGTEVKDAGGNWDVVFVLVLVLVLAPPDSVPIPKLGSGPPPRLSVRAALGSLDDVRTCIVLPRIECVRGCRRGCT